MRVIRKINKYIVLCVLALCVLGTAALAITLDRSKADATKKTPFAGSSSPTPQPTPQFLTPEQIPQISIGKIMSGESVVDADQLDPDHLHTIVATGDIIPARGVDNRIRRHGASYPFQGDGVAELLASGDITIINLEAPLLNDCPVHNEGFTFCGQSSFAKAMSDVGIDIATLSNNHIGNFGQAGINETIQHLTVVNIDYATSQRLAIATHNGFKIGVVSFNGIGGVFDPDQIVAQIQSARPQVDLLIGAFHWGKEYELLPTSDPGVAPDDPRQIAQIAIGAGLDFIIGNHPHWVQGSELMQGKLVTYAHGNFIFDQSWSEETSQGIIGKYTFYHDKLIQVQIYPVMIEDQAQPRLVKGDEAEVILSRYKQSTQQMSGMESGM